MRIGPGTPAGDTGAGPGDDALFPDPSPWHAAWRQGSELARRRSPDVRMELAYGRRPSERLDLYLPHHRARGLPFAALVHVGGGEPPMRADAGFPAKAVHHQGKAFVVIGVDPVAVVGLDGQVDQLRRGWTHLRSHGARYGLDSTRGHLVGYSLGACVAALTAFDPYGPAPVSVVLLSGLYDLASSPVSAVRAELGLGVDDAMRLSPIRQIPRRGPAVLVAWGEREHAELRRQSESMARACNQQGLRVTQVALARRGHVDMSLELAEPHSPVFETLRRRNQ